MLIHYLKFSFRSLMRQKGYTFLNIAGLGVGLSVSLLIAAFVMGELRTDRFHENYPRIHRLEVTDAGSANTPSMTSEMLQRALPEALLVCRVDIGNRSLLYNTEEKQGRLGRVMYADSTFFSIFSFPLLQGHPQKLLRDPSSIVLSRSEAQKIFGDEDPLGKTIRINNKLSYLVTGIMEDFPANSSLKATAVIPFHRLPEILGDPEALNDWNNWNYQTFALLPADHDLREINPRLEKAMDNIFSSDFGFPDVELGFFLRPMKDIYFNRSIAGDSMPKGNLSFIMIFAVIGIFILLIAVVNFINISTAMAFRREKEVGLKKVLGSTRGKLLGQYFTESVMVCLLGLCVALMLFELLLPTFNSLIGAEATFHLLQNPVALLTIIGSTILTGLLAGIYPAFFLSHFQPVSILRGELSRGRRGSILRKILIVFQFTISIGIIMATLVIYSQMRYARNMDMGFDRRNIVFFYNQGEINDRFESFKNELKQIPGVLSVGHSNSIPGYVGMNWGRLVNEEERRINALPVDPEFMEVYGLKISRGRSFDPELQTDRNQAYILNEAAVREFGLEEPLGASFANGRVIGVTEDFSYVSAHHPISPLVLAYMPEWCFYTSIRISPRNIPQTMEQIAEIYKRYAPGFPFNAQFLDQAIGRLYQKEEKLSKLFLFFSSLAIFVACLGLAGLTLFTTQQRTKEIGIRKVFGSSVQGVVLLLTSDFLRWVLLANLIAWPLSWYFMNRWLANFAYHISITWWMFAASGLAALLIATITISFQAVNAAMNNPVKSLKRD